MGKRKHASHSVSKRLAKVEREMKKDKPEVKTLDVLLNPLTGSQGITSFGIQTSAGPPAVYQNYDLTRGFVQGLLNTGGNIDGNYCKLSSMDMRIYLNNEGATAKTSIIRLMIIRLPAAETLTPADVQTQVLEYGAPATYGQLANVSPLKRNSTINGGYDVMYDRCHTLNSAAVGAGYNPNRSTKYIHFRKKWSKGLTLRFSGSGAGLSLEQNRLVLFAMDANNTGATGVPVQLSFVNRIRFSDE